MSKIDANTVSVGKVNIKLVTIITVLVLLILFVTLKVNNNKNLSNKYTPEAVTSITIGIPQDLDNLDPHKAVASGTLEVLYNLFDGLVRVNKDGDIIPSLAESYEILNSGLEYRFTLRDNIYFHNGKGVTVEDVKHSLLRVSGQDSIKDPKIVIRRALTNIYDIVKVDEKTFKIALKEPDTELLAYLTTAIVPADYDNQSKHPIGTGPFKFTSYSPLEKMIVEKNNNYWNSDLPYLDKVIFKVVPNSNSALLEVKSGSLDVLKLMSGENVEELKRYVNVEVGSMNLIQGLFLNNSKAPFDNILVRKAINHAVNKQQILEMLSYGDGTIISSSMLPVFKNYYNSELDDIYPHDLTEAKRLLAEAGYPNGFNMTITVPSNYQLHVDTAQILAEQLKKVNINVTINLVEWTTWLDTVYSKRAYDSTVIGLSSHLAPGNVLERYVSSAYNNFISYNNPDYDILFHKVITEVDQDIKVEQYKQLQKYLTDDAVSVFIQDPPLYVAINKKFTGYTFYPVYIQDASVLYYGVKK